MEGMKILLVDDEERFLSTTKKLLAHRGIEALTATNGIDALKILDDYPIDVVILDIKMPGIDGIDTLRRIKKSHPSIEVIFLTGHATVESAVEGLKGGAFDYLIKPSEVQDIIIKASEAYKKKQAAPAKKTE